MTRAFRNQENVNDLTHCRPRTRLGPGSPPQQRLHRRGAAVLPGLVERGERELEKRAPRAPYAEGASGRAPASSSASTAAVLPFAAAVESGVDGVTSSPDSPRGRSNAVKKKFGVSVVWVVR